MEIKDLAGLSEPLTKFLDLIGKGIGTLYKPRAIRKEADAEAYKVERLAVAEAKKIMIEGEAKISILERAKQRLVYEEIIKQDNLESIAEKSIAYLDESKVTGEEVDPDWRTRFFEKAKGISNEEVQEIWAKILAREFEEPGMISLRTLDLLSNLSKEEAVLFQKFCECIFDGEQYLDFENYSNRYRQNNGWPPDFLYKLQLTGLVSTNPPENQTAWIGGDLISTNIKFSLKDKLYIIRSHIVGLELKASYIPLTPSGKELFGLIDPAFNNEYIEWLFNELKRTRFKVTETALPVNDSNEQN